MRNNSFLQKALYRYSSYSLLKMVSMVLNLIGLIFLNQYMNDKVLAYFFENISLGILIGSFLDFGKSKFALKNGKTSNLDIFSLAFLIGLGVLASYTKIELMVFLVAGISLFSMYFKSLAVHNQEFKSWFLYEITLSLPLIIALCANFLLNDSFKYVYHTFLILFLCILIFKKLKTCKNYVWFDGNLLLFFDSLMYQIITYSFFHLNISDGAKVFFSRQFNMSKALTGIFTSVDIHSMKSISSLRITLIALFSLIIPTIILFLIFYNIYIDHLFLYVFVFLSSISILLSMKFLMSNRFLIRFFVSLMLFLILILINFYYY